MDSVLELFDFDRADHSQPILMQGPNDDLKTTVEMIESATAAGNIPSLAKALSDLHTLPGSGPYLKRPGKALYLAVNHGNHEILEYLLAKKISVTPDAVTVATIARDRRTLDLLLKSGWDINEPLGHTAPSALALAVEDAALTSWLLDRGASPNAQCSLDLTPLSIAVQYSSISIIRSLFEYGGSIKYGQLLHYAVRRSLPDQLEVLDFILSKKPPINHVMYQEQPQSYFRQRMFSLGTPLHEAAEQGRVDIVKKLVESGSHPLIKDSRGEIALQRAQKSEQHSVVAYLSPITATATWPTFQFTEGKETTGWS